MSVTTTIAMPIRVDGPAFAHHLENFKHAVVALAKADATERIVVDYGSTEEYAYQIAQAVLPFKITLIKVDAPAWSRARSLNVALMESTSDLFLPVDADVILPHDYAIRHAEAIRPGGYTQSMVLYLDAGSEKADDAEWLKRTQAGKILQCGFSHCGLPAQWMKEIGGYDERYWGWGCEDDDILRKARRAGLTPRTANTVPVHLYHEHWLSTARATGIDVDGMLAETRKLFNSDEGGR